MPIPVLCCYRRFAVISALRAIVLMFALVVAKANCASPGLMREKEQKREQARQRPPVASAEYLADRFFAHFLRQRFLLLVIRRAAYIVVTEPRFDFNHD